MMRNRLILLLIITTLGCQTTLINLGMKNKGLVSEFLDNLLMKKKELNESLGDLCDENLCELADDGSRREHVACIKNNNYESSCPVETTFIDFKLEERKVITGLHNEIRNLIASGQNERFKSAQRMAFMKWSKSLTYVSSFNVLKCEFSHDRCRNTKRYKYSGQNLGIRQTSNRAANRTELMNHFSDLIRLWIEENKYCNQSFIDFFEPHPNTSIQIGHFTVMVRDENPYVGCSAVEYFLDNDWFYMIACNYATNNFHSEGVYVPGKSCSGCHTGCHANYTALCSQNETYLLCDIKIRVIYKRQKMKFLEKIFVLLVTGWIYLADAQNYCDSSLCSGSSHIACRHSGLFSYTCPADRHLIRLSRDQKQTILNTHNFLRHDIGHFTQMAYDRATHVGCAFARYTDSYKTGLFACNYASGNIKGYKIYKCGSPASGCLFGKNPSYPALCNVNEPIDPNQIY
ncbi:CLUMA_CG017112, isoform B [Clunio marinus]|uniref:CLUMA_CG017112, isoform B n=1 Tax=Clunio marinus TaxID=568069 RepID=A0A1J1IWB7_9DIPT|nr:CLUMA_CG017112, isoform B [Clunio marinus]